MARKVFYSFHYKPDNWRAAKVRNIGMVEGNSPTSDNDWEAVKRGGDAAIKLWIDNQMQGRSCTIVLIGSETAGRKWINYEIEKAWNDGKGLLGVHIHNITDRFGSTAKKGANPFDQFTIKKDGRTLSSIVQSYDPPYWSSQDVYAHVRDHIALWVEKAVAIRAAN